MNYDKALLLLEKNQHLIGKTDNSSTIEELVIIPTDGQLREKFLKIYLQTLKGEKAIQSFIGAEVDVIAVFDKKRISFQGAFLYTNIFNLTDKFKVVIE